MTLKKQQLNKGFSVVELIVIITLFSIMSSVVFFDFGSFRTKIDRSNLATDIALSLRQMQVYGISASNRDIGGTGFEAETSEIERVVNANLILDSSVYSVEIDLDEQTITQFQESGFDTKRYDSDDTLIDILTINGDNQILRVCATSDDITPRINESTGECDFGSINGEGFDEQTFLASFKRPFPDATFYSTKVAGTFDPLMAILVIGEPEAGAEDLEYVYIDKAGLIQLITPEFST